MPDHDGAALLEFPDRFFTAVQAGDIEAVRAMYNPEAVIWHAHDGQRQTVDENLRTLRAATTHIDGFRYEDVRRHATDSGFVEQHVLRGRAPNGAELSVEACIVCTVVDGRITRLDEYFDSAQIAPLLSP